MREESAAVLKMWFCLLRCGLSIALLVFYFGKATVQLIMLRAIGHHFSTTFFINDLQCLLFAFDVAFL